MKFRPRHLFSVSPRLMQRIRTGLAVALSAGGCLLACAAQAASITAQQVIDRMKKESGVT